MTPELSILLGLCKVFEGLAKLLPNGMVRRYICPAGYWTQGYGLLCKDDAPDITPEEAERGLLGAAPFYIQQTLTLCPQLARESPERLAAIADFTFNLGVARLHASTLRKRVNEEDWDGVCDELAKWVNGGGRKLPGLVLRRAAEAALIRKTQ